MNQWWNSDAVVRWRNGRAIKEWSSRLTRLGAVSVGVAVALVGVIAAAVVSGDPVVNGTGPEAAAIEQVEPPPAVEPEPPTEPVEVAIATEGDVDETVEAAQFLLNCSGYGALVVDGIFGPATRGAVETAQQGLGHQVTGEIDAPTFGELSRACSLSRRIGAGAVVGNAAPGDPEVYVMSLTAGSELTVTMADGVAVEVFGPSSTMVPANGEGTWTVPVAGDHQIEVSATGGPITFTIEVSVEEPVFADDAPRRHGPRRGRA
jgi:peptidoglycan hydrolase-like protein with peptidoglycan-binding domain